MLSREDRILSELLVGRGLVTPERMEACARVHHAAPPGASLLEILVDSGEVDSATARSAAAEAGEIDRSLAPALPGSGRLGEFRLVREIGRGGMGIVYEAEQEPLGRRVALKILPAGAALDERLAIRFLREARAAARLSHEGIVPVYTVGREQGALYFAMELVQGQSLAQRLAAGPLAPREAARIAAEVARALAHAHAAGLVHRDIKPENILLDEDGRARLTDFGLVQEAAALPVTLSHHVLGTPAYIAPEQALGEPVDARADIYGLGAVLYTMLAGRPPYEGDVPAAILGRVLAGPPPPLRERRSDVPAALDTICQRAMSRRPADRYPSAQALVQELEAVREPDSLAASPALRVPRRRFGAGRWVLLAAAALALFAGTLWMSRHEARRSRSSLTSDSRPGPSFGLATRASGRVFSPSLSPDGSSIAYTVMESDEGEAFLLQIGGQPASLSAALGRQAGWPCFSPDGDRVALLSGGNRIVVLELATNRLLELDAAGRALVWSPGREILYGSEMAIPVAPSGGQPELWAIEPDSGRKRLIKGMGVTTPQSSPHGQRIAFASTSGGGSWDLWTMGGDGSDARRLIEDPADEWSPVWAPDGTYVYFGSDRGGCSRLWRVRIDEAAGRALAEPELVVPTDLAAPFYLTISGDGRRLALVLSSEPGRVHRFPFDPDEGVLRGAPSAQPRRAFYHGSAHPSPDGRSIVVATAGARDDLLLQDLEGRAEPRGLTAGTAKDLAPRWSPDGKRIAFASDRSGRNEIWTIRPDGSEPRQITSASDGPSRSPVWSPDGTRIAVTREGRGGVLVHIAGASAERAEEPLPALENGPFEPSDWSPDGRILAGEARGIVLFTLSDRLYRRLTDSGRSPAWLPDGRRLLFVTDAGLHLLDSRDGRTSLLYPGGPVRLSHPSLSRDGRDIFATLEASDREIWLLQLAP